MPTSPTQGAAFTSAPRLASLDLFRGFTMAAMVMVNNQPGPHPYAQLHHVPWHGWTFTDLVFPFFLWIAGVAATLSTAKRIDRGEDRATLLGHAFRRFLIIFAIGVALNTLHYDNFRIPGVLQRIALGYFFGTLIYLYLKPVGRLVVIASLFAVYTIGMHPGGYEMGDNFAQRIDSMLLAGRLYRDGTWDPEGVWSTLPSIATFLFGAFTGDLLRSTRDATQKVQWMLGAGFVFFVLGLALDPVQPINKALWTVPYVFLTAGLASLGFGLCYWLVDLKAATGPWLRFFTIFGVNALAVYIFHFILGAVFGKSGMEDGVFNAFLSTGPSNAALLYSLIHVVASFLFAWLLWSRRWFLKI